MQTKGKFLSVLTDNPIHKERENSKSLNTHLIYAIALISLALAAIATFSAYPFIFTADGGGRVDAALAIFEGRTITQTLLTHVQTVFMYFAYEITNNFAFYTLAQSFLIFFSLSLLIKRLMGNYRFRNKWFFFAWFFVSIIFSLFPVTFGFSVILTDSSGVIVGMCLCLFLLFQKSKMNYVHISVYFLMLVFSFTMLFGFRLNSMIILPIVLCVIIFFRPVARKRRIVEGVALVCSLAFIFQVVPNIAVTGKVHPESLGFAWDIIGIAKETQDDKYMHILDFAGDTEMAIERYNPTYLNDVFWDKNPPLPALLVASPKLSGEIRGIYLETILNDPRAFIRHKFNAALLVAGIKGPLLDIRRGIHGVDEFTIGYGATDTKKSRDMRGNFFDWTESYSALALRPYVLFLISSSLLWVIWRLNRNNFGLWLSVYLCAITYYIGFFINTQAMEFRYFAPTFFVLGAMSLCVFTILLDWIVRYIREVIQNLIRQGG